MFEIQPLTIADKTFKSRLFIGSGKFSSGETLARTIQSSGSELVTVALKRMEQGKSQDPILDAVKESGVNILPNTSGVRDAKEAVFAAQLAREALGTNWVKLEVHPDPRYLMPDPVETLKAAEQLVKEGFVVMPYIHADPVLCKRLEDVGVQCVMPLGAPIGTNLGLETRILLEMIIDQSSVPVIVDAGIGAPSHACEALEMGADAVLVNTAMAVAPDPEKMGWCFRQAVESGRLAFESGLALKSKSGEASATSPLTGFLNQ